MDIHCDHCNKFLFRVEGRLNPGAVGAEAQRKGFVYKNASLFSSEYSSLYFCGHACGKAFYKKNIPRNPELSEALEDVKARIPEMAKIAAKNINKLIKKWCID